MKNASTLRVVFRVAGLTVVGLGIALASAHHDHQAAWAADPTPDSALPYGGTTGVARGQAIYTQICVACHGDRAQGIRALNSPSLHQQEHWYIVAQLEKFRDGIRGGNPADDVTGAQMAPMAKSLPDAQALVDLADFITAIDGPPVVQEIQGADVEAGKQQYATVCVACHGVEGGGMEALKAPALAGQSDWYMVAQLKKFKSGARGSDPRDVSGLQMKGMAAVLADDTAINNIAAYIATMAPVGGAVLASGAESPAEAEPIPEASAEQVAAGADLFQGMKRFEAGGPACNSCHDVQNDAVIGGGILAIELTEVFGRLGGPGVRAILGAPPFPVMQQAYRDQPLTGEEVTALVAFLQQADRDKLLHQPRDYGIKLFVSGVVGVAILLLVHSVIWRRRRKASVNQPIFDRQINASN